MLFAADFTLGDVLSTLFVAGLFAVWVLLVILMLADMYGDPGLSGWAKAGWTLLIIALPLIGIFAYLIVRGDDMGRRIGAHMESKSSGADDS